MIWLLVYNVRFWEATFDAMWHPSSGAVLFMAALGVLVLTLQAILILLWPTRWLMRAATSVLFVIAAAGSYFCNEYGAIMNQDMMRNVLQTDPAEAGALMNPELLLQVLLLGVLPAMLVWRVRLPVMTWKSQLLQRGLFIIVALTISMAGLFANSADFAVFFREHKLVRYTLSPSAAATSMIGILAGSHDGDASQPLIDPAGNVQHTAAATARPLVLFLVVGETARAANFQLGGYARPTNPELSLVAGLTYFQRSTSCGTSTAISVPCLFSHLGRADFNVDTAGRYANLLDSLVKGGFDVEWRDNNSSCKGVCPRVASVDYTNAANADYCTADNCYDEVMLADLPAKLRGITKDTVIVFHQKGSHGPAYFERYPPAFEKFKPACRSNQLQHCSAQEIINAYDNTIAYTDHVLAKQIALLRKADDRLDGLLIYASDHGESLGENSIYLHGMPFAFAPDVQKQVPMLMWASAGYVSRARLQGDCLRTEAALPVSHDFFYHTVLGAAELRNAAYDRRLDLLSGCRRGGAGE